MPSPARCCMATLAGRTGGGSVLRADLTGLVQRATPGTERDCHFRRDAADCTPVRGRTRRSLRANLHTDARAALLEPRRAPRHHGFPVDGPAAARLCEGRGWRLGRP